LNTFFSRSKLPPPSVVNISVDGGQQSAPGGEADAEVALDQQFAAGVYAFMTGKSAQIRTYWCPNTAAALGQGIAAAAADGCDTVSISWGMAELEWGAYWLTSLNNSAGHAVALGTTVMAAAGDNGWKDGTSSADVDAPSSCPNVLACGGTMRPHNRSASNPETVWNESGGGYSSFFPMPAWQTGKAPAGPGRMVSDVGAIADPTTGLHIIVGGQDEIVGGTSADAPFYAGLLAACGRKLGLVAPKLWANPQAFRPITVGNNGDFPGPVCCGLGVPNGAAFTALFS